MKKGKIVKSKAHLRKAMLYGWQDRQGFTRDMKPKEETLKAAVEAMWRHL